MDFVQYKCPCCGAALQFSPGTQKLSCASCGNEYDLETLRQYEQKEYCALAAHGYRIVADAVETGRRYEMRRPVLLLCGAKDAAGSGRRYNRSWSRETGYNLVWVPGAGHNANCDQPDFVNGKIEQFIRFLPV